MTILYKQKSYWIYFCRWNFKFAFSTLDGCLWERSTKISVLEVTEELTLVLYAYIVSRWLLIKEYLFCFLLSCCIYKKIFFKKENINIWRLLQKLRQCRFLWNFCNECALEKMFLRQQFLLVKCMAKWISYDGMSANIATVLLKHGFLCQISVSILWWVSRTTSNALLVRLFNSFFWGISTKPWFKFQTSTARHLTEEEYCAFESFCQDVEVVSWCLMFMHVNIVCICF